jgi:hypothetical protein
LVSDIWDTAKSTGVIDHMDAKQAHAFEFIYTNVDRLRASQDDETATVPQLGFLSFNETLDPQLRAQSLIALARLDVINSHATGYSRQLLSTVKSMHLVFGPATWGGGFPTFEAARRHILNDDRERYGRCVADVSLKAR